MICGGISHTLHAMLESVGVSVITGIAGEVEEVLSAFMSHGLDDPKFSMPGLASSKVSRREDGARPLADEDKETHID